MNPGFFKQKAKHYPSVKIKIVKKFPSVPFSCAKKIFSFALLLLVTLADSSKAEMLSIVGDRINSRSGPGVDYTTKWEYSRGFPVEIVERNKNWVKIKDFENDIGWIHKSFLSNIPHVIVKANKDLDKKINIRQGPGSKNKIVGEAYYGVVFKILQKKADWIEVQHESGLTGWVSNTYLWGY